ncbi:MAG: KTSC domain-containing protein [Pyrinomonadaceae bacterium]
MPRKPAQIDEDGFELVENSSNVHSHKFDSERDVITLRFHNGTAYEYPNCSDKLYADLKAAASVGSFVAKQLRPRPYVQIADWK